ncbi:MAG TPA: acetyltransferase [Flavobacteriia bacterium]|nr:acetyltransferase [Flavobacteriia bacterium]
MKKIAIIGAGGFGREVKNLIEQINKHIEEYIIIGFFDDNIDKYAQISGLPVLGKISEINNINTETYLVFGIGDPKFKQKIFKTIKNKNIIFPTLIHPSVIKNNNNIKIGDGSIICAGTILTCDIVIGNFVLLNLCCTVGHDAIIKNFSSFMPSVNISGEVIIEDCVYVGTGATIINKIKIGENSIIGAGALVSKKIPSNCTAVGIPAKPIKFHNN